MTVIDMHRNALLKSKTLDRSDLRDLQSHDWLALLNNAQDIFIDQAVQQGNWAILRPLITSVEDISPFDTGSYVTGITGAQAVNLTTLATDFRNFYRSESKMTRTYAPTVASGVYVKNEPTDPMDIHKFETNGSNKPIFTNPKQILEGNYLVVLPDFYTTITNIQVVYVRVPDTLVLDTPGAGETATCELPSETHQDIVDLAVKLSYETVNINDVKK